MDTLNASTPIERVFYPVANSLTRDFARRLVKLRPDPLVEQRLEELAGKSTAGLLTDEERSEYESLIIAGDLVAILQATAHSLLTEPRHGR